MHFERARQMPSLKRLQVWAMQCKMRQGEGELKRKAVRDGLCQRARISCLLAHFYIPFVFSLPIKFAVQIHLSCLKVPAFFLSDAFSYWFLHSFSVYVLTQSATILTDSMLPTTLTCLAAVEAGFPPAASQKRVTCVYQMVCVGMDRENICSVGHVQTLLSKARNACSGVFSVGQVNILRARF